VGTTIATKLHELADQTNSAGGRPTREHPSVARMLSVPNYVVGPDVFELLKREDARSSIKALCEAGLARLPFPQMVVEFRAGTLAHEFVLLEETENEHVINMTWAMLRLDNGYGLLVDQVIPFEISQQGITPLRIPSSEMHRQALLVGGAIAIGVALLMLNTKGIEKQVVECSKLNKHRVRSGKTAIPKHSVLHIGMIYRRDGTGERFQRAGHHKRMHLRAGHTRRQHYGPQNQDVKIVYVPPVIVNFKPDEELVQPKKVIRV
jgi:hypothetical protein